MRLALLAAVSALAMPLAAQTDGASFFEKNIRPVLVERCLVCHSAASNPVMGAFRIDSREGLLKGGSRGPAIVEGDPAGSLLLKALRHVDGSPKMPPGKRLSDAEIAAFTQWVEMGAPWGAEVKDAAPKEEFWSFVPPKAPAIPAVKDRAWVQSPIDAFILAGLEAKGLKPAPPADRRTLIRRLTYDLTGLPPTPAEVRAFLNDQAPGAVARVVDRLLASPRYGEKWGRHWLDVARYADSNGLDENLVYKNAYRYRDYVIDAFNKDKPYDQFVHEQLAGDLLPPASDLNTQFERWTATGFLSLGAKMLAEDDPVKMQMDIVDEQLDTMARTFMGLTVGCARCHDHKFDPIPQADYYSLAGIFKSSKTMEHFKVVAKWHEYVLAPEEDRKRLAEHEAKIEAKREAIGKLVKAENETLSNAARQRVGAYLLASHDVAEAAKVTLDALGEVPGAIVREADGFENGNVDRPLKKKQTNTVKDAEGPHFAEYRIQAPRAGNYQIDILDEERGKGTADLLINGELMKRGAPPVENREASPDEGGWAPLGVFELKAGENVIRLEHDSRFPYFGKLQIAPADPGRPAPKTLVQIARQHGVSPSFLEQLVAHLARSDGAPASQLYAWETFGTGKPLSGWDSPVAKLFEGRTYPDRAALAQAFQEKFLAALADEKTEDPGLKALRELLFEKFGPFRAPKDARSYYPAESVASIKVLEKEQKALEQQTPEFPRAMGVTEGPEIADLAIHVRGSHWTLGETVPRRFLSSIADGDNVNIGNQTSGRLELARWLTGKNHPLTARVMANRIWRWHFGEGIVPSVDNFGRLGEKPTNQPLLDWLAVQFVKQGWSVKKMHRLMLLSSTYQMSSRFDAKSAEVDPENALLWRMPRQRLAAEEIRDAIMAVAEDLNLENPGSIMKYKDRQYVANTSRRGDIDYDRNIRAVYLPVVRSSMYEVFTAFDLPDPSMANGDRDSTVVAPQALFMMNGSVVLRHTRSLAEKLLADPRLDDAGRVTEVYERALTRPPSPAEIDRALTFIARMEQAWQKAGNAGETRALAWQSFCKSLLASNEFLYLN